MNILAIGDVVGDRGCEFLRSKLPGFKKLKQIDLCIVNGENSAQGNGITPYSANHLLTSGADIITTGNHVYRRKEFYEFIDSSDCIIRPANFPDSCPGSGIAVADMGRCQVAVINIMGTVYMEPLGNPFECADKMIEKARNSGCKIIIVDFHAEATAEKRALGFYLDGRVSALFGTHTHVLTADAQVLPEGTGYITDIGMTGPKHSVLGVTPALAIEKMKTNMPVRFENPDTPCYMCGCIFTVDKKTGKTLSTESVSIE